MNISPTTGNCVQNGTPTPTTPVEVVSIGNKTAQLLAPNFGKGDFSSKVGSDMMPLLSANKWINLTPIEVKPLAKYSFKNMNKPSWIGSSAYNIYYYGLDKKLIKADTGVGVPYNGTITIPENCYYINLSTFGSFVTNQKLAEEYGSQVMIVEGSILPSEYIPYGYQISVIATGANGSQTTTSVYLKEPLRKVGNYTDVLNYKKGIITRNVGVKVLDGTEDWLINTTYNVIYNLNLFSDATASNRDDILCSHLIPRDVLYQQMSHGEIAWGITSGEITGVNIKVNGITTLADWKAYLAEQYANGTPVTIYYPLATPVVERENWLCNSLITEIEIATTKMVDEEFAAAEAKLATIVQTIESVVSRTIDQTEQIQILQDTKQTRPDENCPANMKCLLVQDEDGTPHWYPIIEP